MKKWYKRKRFYLLVSILIVITFVIIYNSYKPLPDGISYEGKIHHVEDIDFIYDLSYHDKQGNLQHEQAESSKPSIKLSKRLILLS